MFRSACVCGDTRPVLKGTDPQAMIPQRPDRRPGQARPTPGTRAQVPPARAQRCSAIPRGYECSLPLAVFFPPRPWSSEKGESSHTDSLESCSPLSSV